MHCIHTSALYGLRYSMSTVHAFFNLIALEWLVRHIYHTGHTHTYIHTQMHTYSSLNLQSFATPYRKQLVTTSQLYQQLN